VLISIGPKGTPTNVLGLNERSECIIRSGAPLDTLLSIPKFPLPLPLPNQINHEILPTPAMGFGVFATRDLKFGDLIFAERPLICIPRLAYFSPRLQDPSLSQGFDIDKYIEPCFEKLTPEDRAAYHELSNSHTSDGSGPLLGVVRTNGFGVVLGETDSVQHSAVYKQLCRVNHRYNIDLFC
jgi:hypothetical protein